MSEQPPRPARKPRAKRARTPAKADEPTLAARVEPASNPTGDPQPPSPGPEVEPTPLEVPLEDQITALPLLEFPGSRNEEFDEWAAEKRRNRIRVEIYGGALLVLVGVVATVVTGRTAFIIIALFAVGGLGAYEFLVTSFE